MRTVLDESSVLGDIAALMSEIKDTDDANTVFKLLKKKRNEKLADPRREFLGGSIAKYSKDLTMTFPTLIDNSLSPETASMISKANERKIVTMIQMLFASMQITARDGREVIQRIYGNKRGLAPMSYDDAMDNLLNFYDSNKQFSPFHVESAVIGEDAMAEYVKKMEAELKRPIKFFPTDSFSDNSLNDYSVLDINGTKKVKFAPVQNIKEDYDDGVMDGGDPEYYKWLAKYGYKPDEDEGFLMQDPRNLQQKASSYVKDYNAALSAKYARQYQKGQEELGKNKFAQQQNMDRAQIQQMRQQYRKDNQDILSKQILDSDIKKANEMQPTLIIINFSEVDANDNFRIMDQRAFVAGVKSRLISVNSSDIVDRIVAKNKTRVNFLNFIRATTGEISFMKDFILCLKQAKIDAKNSIKRGQAAEMWKTLEALSVKNNRNKLRKAGNDASAITTLVINQETANLIQKEYDINVENLTTARQIMNDYNLLGIIIADESVELVKFLYDGQDMFEQQAYSFLEKENADKSYKKIINLMSQNRRF